MIDLDTGIESTAADMAMSKQIAEILHKSYSGHMWAVRADCKNGMANACNLALSGEYGFYLRLVDIQNDPGMKVAVRLGGELLERYRVDRTRLNNESLLGKQRDFRGNFLADTSK